jgi:tRNA(fMet)-specific endonuclease VapC
VLGCPACAEHGRASDELSSHYAAIRAELEAEGEVIADNDLWIAAHARALNLTVVTNNTRHFGRVPGLAVEDWTA